jgi:hypothetical protein
VLFGISLFFMVVKEMKKMNRHRKTYATAGAMAVEKKMYVKRA